MLINIIIFIILIACSAFFSASETAIFSLSNLKLRRLSEKYPAGKVVNGLLKKPTHLLSAIVFGNLLVNIGFASLSTALFVSIFGERGLVLAIFISGIFILFLGEIFPKTFAIYTAEKASLIFSPLLNILSKIFFPIIIVIETIVSFFSSFIIRKTKKHNLSDEEFRTALFLGKKGGEISEAEEEMISYVLEFKETWASEIVTARIDIKGIDSESTQSQVMDILRQEKHSKFPVYKDSLDHIIGILYAKDVFLNPDQDYHQFLHEPIFIPESMGIDDVLKLFYQRKERIAIVLDEYGGTEGIVTVEDIEEEIFGEIYDEFETPQEPVEKLGKKQWRVYGKTPTKTVNLELELDLPEEEDTIAGFLLSKMEKIPRPQDKFKFSTSEGEIVEFTVERATVRRIVTIIMEIK
jgi:putative hemolysin